MDKKPNWKFIGLILTGAIGVASFIADQVNEKNREAIIEAKIDAAVNSRLGIEETTE